MCDPFCKAQQLPTDAAITLELDQKCAPIPVHSKGIEVGGPFLFSEPKLTVEFKLLNLHLNLNN